MRVKEALALQLPRTTREREAVVEPLLVRVAEAIQRLLAEAPLDVLKAAAAAPTGAGSLAALVSHLPEASPALAAADPEAAAVARAAEIKAQLVKETPTYSTAEVASLLGVSAEAIRKQRVAGKLLAFEYASDWRFPGWQFTPSGPLPGLRRVLEAMPVENPWVRLELVTAPLPEHGGQSVADLLRSGDVDTAVAVVAAYGEHGA